MEPDWGMLLIRLSTRVVLELKVFDLGHSNTPEDWRIGVNINLSYKMLREPDIEDKDWLCEMREGTGDRWQIKTWSLS